MMWFGGVDRGVSFAAPAGCPLGYGRGVRHSGAITGGAPNRALLGCGLLVACYVSTFRGVSWASADRVSWAAIFGKTYLILMNITSTQGKQTPFF